MKQRNPVWLRLAAITSILAALAFSLFSVATIFARPATGNSNTTAVFQGRSNNGTVKIDNVAIDNIPENNPHQSCTFFLQFYGFDPGTASYNFALQAPTRGTSNTLATGTVTLHSPSGSDRFNGSKQIDLSQALANSGATPQRNQGYHVRLTVTTPSGVKHKVFWVGPCGTTTTTTTTTGTTTTGTTTTTTGTTTTTTGTTTTTTGTTTTLGQIMPETGSTSTMPYGILLFAALIVGGMGFALRHFQRRKA
jgi:hypothetical protein